MSIYYFFKDDNSLPFTYMSPTRMTGLLPLPYKTTMSPEILLEFAIEDLKEGSTRSLVNSFSNTKRATHLAIDILLNQYGLFTHFKKRNFPSKLQILDSVGILPITIMKNLNLERNLLEHEYVAPSKKRVAEAVDVTRLMLMAIEKLTETTPQEAILGWKNPKRHVVAQLEPIQGVLNLHTLTAPGKYKKTHGIIYFSGGFREFSGERVKSGVRISKKPWKTIVLNKSQTEQWKPIICELVNTQRKQSSLSPYVDHGEGTVTTSVTIPLPRLKNSSWSKLLDEFMSGRNKERNKKQ